MWNNSLGQSRAGVPGIDLASRTSDLRKHCVWVCVCLFVSVPQYVCVCVSALQQAAVKEGEEQKERTSDRQIEERVVERELASVVSSASAEQLCTDFTNTSGFPFLFLNFCSFFFFNCQMHLLQACTHFFFFGGTHTHLLSGFPRLSG